MKLGMLILVLLTACLLALSVVSCDQAQSKRVDSLVTTQRDMNTRLIEEYKGAVLQVGPVEEPIGGSAVVIIPTDDFVLQLFEKTMRKVPARQVDLMVQHRKDYFFVIVEALRRRSLFDEVELVQSDDQYPSFDEDFAVIPSRTNLEWIVKQREPMQQRSIQVQARDSSMSFRQWLTILLDSIEQGAKDLKREGEK